MACYTVISNVKRKLSGNRFYADSFWAVFGNGVGYGLLLLAGIVIARLLGKDIYGEYGMVKTTMFQLAAFSTLGLGYTSTKFIAEFATKDTRMLGSVVAASLKITMAVSIVLALAIIIGAVPLARFLEDVRLVVPFRALGIIIVLRALATTQFGLLAGFGMFRVIAYSNMYSGIAMLVGCVPLTFYFGLSGALASLAFSQVLIVVFNAWHIEARKRLFPPQQSASFELRLIKFSIPVALQEFTFAMSSWAGILMITKLSAIGEVGLFTAAGLWSAVILFVPSFLSNVMLSHLSAHLGDGQRQKADVAMMLRINFISTLLPFLLIYILSAWIVSFYGPTFTGLVPVMRILVCSAIFTCLSNVLSAELIAQGCTWALFSIRCVRDLLILTLGYAFIQMQGGVHAAQGYAWSTLLCSALFFGLLYGYYHFKIKRGMLSVSDGHGVGGEE